MHTLPGAGSVRSVSCGAADNCLAVSSANTTALAESWDGTAWQVHPTPRLPVTRGQMPQMLLDGVSCTSFRGCVAVGASDTYNGNGSVLTLSGSAILVETWNEVAWKVTNTPSPADRLLYAVSCKGSFCMAVGGTQGQGYSLSPLAVTGKGTAWTVQSLPAQGHQTYLKGVSCPSVQLCVAVGTFNNSLNSTATALVWAGTSWRTQILPVLAGVSSASLSDVSCTSVTACTAVGSYILRTESTRSLPLVETWNGTTWRTQPSPALAASAMGTGLDGISCPSPGICTAVGYSGSNALIETEDGSPWQIAQDSSTLGSVHSLNFLNAVSCYSATDCVATGTTDAGSAFSEVKHS